jgi:hypothetical protein
VLLGLWRLAADPGPGLFQAAGHRQGAAVEVDVAPTDREDLAPPHAGGETHHYRPINDRALDPLEGARRLLGGESRHLLPFQPWGSRRRNAVAGLRALKFSSIARCRAPDNIR